MHTDAENHCILRLRDIVLEKQERPIKVLQRAIISQLISNLRKPIPEYNRSKGGNGSYQKKKWQVDW